MYCRYCGKEIANDSNYCPVCGANLKTFSANGYSHIFRIFKIFITHKKHKKLSFFYLFWLLINICLFVFSSPKGIRYIRESEREYDLSDGFYPFDNSLSNVFQGEDYTLSLFNINVYDFSEFLFYTLLLPILIWGGGQFGKSLIHTVPNLFRHYVKLHAVLTVKHAIYRRLCSLGEGITTFLKKNKVWIIVYVIWLILHVVLYILSLSEWDYLKDNFYPFDGPFEYVVNRDFSLLSFSNIEVYDGTEFLVYAIILPIIILGFVEFLSSVKIRKKGKEKCVTKREPTNTNQMTDVVNVAEVVCDSKFEDELSANTTNDVQIETNRGRWNYTPIEHVKQKLNNANISTHQETADNNWRCEKQQVVSYGRSVFMKRLKGTLIDKGFILTICFLVIVFFGKIDFDFIGDLGIYSALFHMTTEDVHNSAIGSVMLNYPGDYISQHQAEINEHFSYLQGIELKITYLFVIIYIIYYYLFESILGVSIGKYFYELTLINSSSESINKISFLKVFLRAMCSLIMISVIIALRWLIGFNYYVAIIVFFLFIDLPVLFSDKSLIDIVTCTKLVYKQRKKRK